MSKRTVVIGAGMIGLLCGLELRHAGHDVVILDRRHVGSGSSSGNAGWIVPSMSAPVPAPGLIGTSLRWLLQRGSPLAISPKLALSSPEWLLSFARHCREEPHRRGHRAMLDLSREAFQSFDRLKELGVDFEVERRGVLFLSKEQRSLESALAGISKVTSIGHAPPVLLDRYELREIEPALSGVSAGAVYVREEQMTRPEALVTSIRKRGERCGVVIVEDAEVTGATFDRERIVAVHTAERSFQADCAVITAGAWSGEVGKRFGIRLPVIAGKGYSITIEEPAINPRISWDLIDERVAITPFPGALRLAGAMELTGPNSTVNRRRLHNIWHNARPYFRERPHGKAARAWVGLRPMTPDGLPIIGRYPAFENLYVATGHGMLGLTLGPVTAQIVADQVAGRETFVDAEAFAPDRFQ
ncbi:MAG: NAD(P)/FAD-dependent oxidoreductase [Chloroflexota bacterium]